MMMHGGFSVFHRKPSSVAAKFTTEQQRSKTRRRIFSSELASSERRENDALAEVPKDRDVFWFRKVISDRSGHSTTTRYNI